ncbi:E3 ubiquitin-protein ligase RNF213 isoform X3 [Cricetulus griseus]|uniref:E3 ubiquitin-protein ligase RNF213 n=1 Tax=Cricetulus griseus TaxID=10029 RepID=A0A9J7KBA0_CRIGR|nr:E3 ubiquitin-protein ligase RNF213 isoform X3 [Cricetulus griseus]XP_035303221.1 E3 ubiquitin-protein ligase RNF213 isoform X3 [Cricetulus griseus]
MECPRCQHVSQENAPKFCSECGQKLPPATPVQDSENNNAFLVASSSEEKTDLGQVLTEEEVPGSSKELETPEESESDASWTIQMEVDPEVFVDASEDTAGGPEGAQCPPSKKKKKETAGFEVMDAEQSKKEKRRRKSQITNSSSEAGSLSPTSGLWSLDTPSSLGSQDSALPQNQAQQQGGVGSQPGQSLATLHMPMEEGGSVLAEGNSSPLQGHTVKGTDSGPQGGAQRDPVPSNHTGVKDLNTSKPSVDKGLPPEGDCGPALSASKGPCKDTDASQRAPLPESKGEKSEHKEEVSLTAELAASEPIDATAKAAKPERTDGKETRDNAQKQKLSPEAELKGRLTDTGKNTQPEDQKKPEENRNYAAALKNKKEERNQKAAAPEATRRTLSPGDGVTVYFHAIVSRDFAFNPDNHRVCVRGGEGLGRKAWSDACEMNYTKDLNELGSLVEGSMVIPRQSLDKPIPYKYVIHRGGSGSKDTAEYEFIYEQPQKKGEHVNRSLLVESALLETRDWHQYDDIICMKPPGKFQRVWNTFTDGTRRDLVKGKKNAAVVMLGRIFSVLQPWSAVNLQSFMTQFKQFYSVVRVPKVHEGQARTWSSLQYEEKEVRMNLWEHVRKQMQPFLEGKSGDALPADCPVGSKLKLGLTVLFMMEAVDFVVSKNDLVWLCYLLTPSAGSLDALLSDLSPIVSKPQKWCVYLIGLCHRCITDGVERWLGTLPVLHHCTQQLSPPRKDSKSLPEDTWAGLEGISFAHFRDKELTKCDVLKFMKPRMDLLYLDEHLFRSWFSVVPLENLTSYLENSMEYLSHVPARVLDCFQGVSYRLRGLGKVSQQNTEDIECVFKMLIHLVDIYQDTILEETLLQIYLTECLTLHETVCKLTSDRKFYEIPALSAELVCKMIKLKPPGGTTEGSVAKDNEDLVTNIFQEALSTTRHWLRRLFKNNMFFTSIATVRFTYPEEMAMWRRLVEIDFPGEYGWKGSLLGDMEGRLKQEQPRVQISVFCSSQWRDGGLHDSVARSFEKCVIEAVSSACQSQTSVLEGLSCQDLQKFGTLLSAVITKSWPMHHGKAVDGVNEIFKYLLTWPDVKQLFRLCGTNEKILDNITEEGRQLMAMAESVFQKVAEELENGTIVVGQLELILEHRTQFVDIWGLSRIQLPLQERACDLKDLLTRRKDDLRFLKREKRYVESLLRQFGRVKHLVEVELGDIEAIHSQDLSKKKLNEALIKPPGSSPHKRMTHYCLSPEIREIASKLDLLKDSHIFQVFWQEEAELLSTQYQDGRELKLQLLDACNYLYYPCYKKFYSLYENVKSGEITFAEVDVVFRDFVDKYDDLTADLKFMCAMDPQDQKGWILKRVGQIKEYHSLHQAVSSAKVIVQVQSTLGVTGDFSVLDTLLNFADSFEDFSHENLKQISQEFIQAKKLLQDITEPRHRCLEELSRQKELVDWLHEALEDINELKVFVDLASISAGENDIDVDRVACFHDAVQGYASLLYKMDSGTDFYGFMDHLQELWRALDNDQHLPSKLQDSARNLEWLKTVKESHGSVELSSLSLATAINNKGIYVIQAPKGGQKVSPDTVLHLLLPEGHGAQEAQRTYSTEELKELLNKLMLMSGKKDHNSNLEVEKFSEVFSSMLRLVHAFINLHCAGNMLFRTWTAEVYCRPRSGVSIRMDFGLELVNTLAESGDVIELLGALCRQMENFLDDWKTVVTQKRAKHFYLNFYTAEQLVYLSSELMKCRPSEAALMMLSFIKGNCTVRDILEATSSHESKAARQCQMKAVKHLSQQLRSESSLMGKLRVIMEQSTVCMSAFLPDCLDLDALGTCLAHLATLGDSPVERPLPKGLQVGQPNLVLCGHSEVLSAALAIYMQDPRQPLPTFDEVLLCTPGTTVEEVELLLRRCLTPGSQEHKIYSLLFADQLSYEVGCRAEDLFQTLGTQRHLEDYQLVIICDAAREHCYLPSTFSQHKVPLVPQAPLPDIQAYLEKHYQVPKQTPSAAAVFRDRMCVGIVTSERAGVGKSLYVNRLHENLKMKLKDDKVPLKVIRLTDPHVDESRVLRSLLPFLKGPYQKTPMIVHIDVSTSVRTGIPVFLFKLLILQYLMDINGKMWLRNPCHLYIVEISQEPSVQPMMRSSRLNAREPLFKFLDIFPKVMCRPPKEVIDMELTPEGSHREPGMDPMEFISEAFQRPYQYLRRFHQNQNLDTFQYKEGSVEGSPEECLQHFLIYCGVVDPSWAELRNFAWFLNCQLKDCEASVFCNSAFTGDTLRGFKNFVVTFMILMARDFATPSLHTSDQSPGNHLVTMDGVAEEDLAPFSLRKRWESEPHPYVFFNGDRMTMTFIGFHLQPNNNGYVNAINPSNGKVIKRNVMTKELFDGLKLQRVPFNIDFDDLPRYEKLERLCLALGIEWPIDPDETYELTTDNMLKILAIEMRFRCGIPVIVMGETGCGKTRLIKFLSDLKRGSVEAETMKLVKVHGGTTPSMIYSRVKDAERTAFCNMVQHNLDTILFFDEANTTEAVSCIKEVLCDGTADGECLHKSSGLHIIAACNPYRKHSQEMILRLESAGLGYRVSADETADRLGSIPLRQLVYRVHALPPSLIPLVWDFGQLNDAAENLYIQQIVQRLVDSHAVADSQAGVIVSVLSASQRFMRKRENECGFVSLRDVERCVSVFRWFHDHSEMLLKQLDGFLQESSSDSRHTFERDPVLWSLVMATGVCYHASLQEKAPYRKAIGRYFPEPYNDSNAILEEITHAQDLFLRGAPIRTNIARNLALKENVFMMVICIELKIPLFLVGKPGSSKSLAKTIVADAMQGQSAFSDLFRCLKQVHLVSFQCSPHSTPQGIIGTFRQCARFQQGKDLQQYVSVVVLDEVGLAEDSPKMPLKTLHPLLEDGCIEDDPAPYKKVGFVGISNWALDPAKMNRGIFVSRGSPNEKELIESAEGICSSDRLVQDRIRGYFAPFAKAYERVCQIQDKEFFGLRDYYSLIKMVFAKAKASNQSLSPQDIAHAVLRNFSGKDNIQALDIFTAGLPESRHKEEVSTVELIKQNIYSGLQASSRGLDSVESRYLLVLTSNYVALQILQQTFFGEGQQPEIIFGSSFPQDQEYTQICRNINRVKICMETGKMVVLLNLQNLYESLYDALNQYYVYLGGQKYVDLGLGTHRVKCRVHPDFRLIVIEEKDVVYRQFPVPLINRLEKHYLDINTMLEGWQKGIVSELQQWACEFADTKADQLIARHKYSPADVFIGYHSDACASVVLQAVERQGPRDLTEELYRKVSEEAKFILLECATADAVVRLSGSSLGSFTAEQLSKEYYHSQQHNSFADFLQAHLRTAHLQCQAVFTEITTFSRLLTSSDCEVLESELRGLASKIMVLSLQQFDTEYSFLKEVRCCLMNPARCKILVIQTDFDDGVHSAQLVASAKYSAINEINKTRGTKDFVFVYFITKLSRMGSGTSYVGFHGGLWRSVHIDDLHRSTIMASDVTKLQNVTISQLFKPGDKPKSDDSEEAMETETIESGEMAEEKMETECPEEMEMASDPGGCEVLDTTRLLRSCVQSAVGMLRDQDEGCARNMRRVTILLGLLNEDNMRNASFLWESKMRLHVLLKKQEENQVCSLKAWVAREAANQDALQEAGTFRHTLWKRVQGVVTPFLASMISYMDRDGNLELLAQPDSPAWAQDLWMFIFRDIKFLNIPLVVTDTRSQNEMPSIVVQSPMNLLKDACNAVPFSWRIRDYLEELWVQAQYITDTEGLSKKLVEIFQKTPLGRFLAQLPVAQQQDILQRYLKDFLLLTMKVASREELKCLQMALWSCLQELRAASGEPEEGLSLPWVHLAYHHFRTRLQNLSRLLTIHPQVLESLHEAAQTHSLAASEMTLDAFAAVACVEVLKGNILKPSPRAWVHMVKNLSMPLELVCSSGYLQGCGNKTRAVVQEVRALWNRIFSIALFVEHVLLETNSQIPELSQLVTTSVFLLDKCLQENSDLKTYRPFVAVMEVLCECKDKVSRTLSRFGVQPCHICLEDAQDPVCLPCDHVYCLRCIKTWLVPGQMACPYCLTDLPDKFSPTVSQEHRKAIEKHAQFRHMCNSFFVDLVSTMCFKDDTPPQESVIDSLLSLLFIQKELLRDAPQKHREHTKSLSPFGDVVDKTPVIRSVVLKLLLKYSFHEVKDYIQNYLTQLENKAFPKDDKTELYLLFINCLEDSVHGKTSAGCRSHKQDLGEEGHFLRTYSPGRLGQEPASTASVEYLQEVARVRLCLDLAADFLSELQEGSELAGDKQCFLKHVEQFCTRVKNDWHRVYLVRKLASQRGMEFVQSFSRQGHPCQWVFPRGVIQQQRDDRSQMDRYLVHGDEYKALRDAVGKAVLESKTLDIGTALMACRSSKAQQTAYLLLALYREVASLYRSCNANLHPKPEQCKAMHKFIEESKILSVPNIGPFAKSLVDDALPLLRTRSANSSLEGTVTEMAVHAATIFLCGQNKVLGPLRTLAFHPAKMANAFLPTMPEDLLVQARSWAGLEHVSWYNCPNGHPCSVGECGMPMEQSFCPDCHAQIGGLNHKPHQGFHLIRNNEDRTQTGHVLGDLQPGGVEVASDRGLSPVVFILSRLLTHLAMLVGATQDPQALTHIIKPRVQDPQGFLQKHIQRNLEQLTKMLGKSADETTHVVHLILSSLLKERHPVFGQRVSDFNTELSTKGSRNNWEKHFEALLLPELERLDKTLPAVNALISQDERISSNPVAKIIYGDPATFLPHLPQKSVVHCSKIWSCRKKITLEYLQHIVDQKNGKETVPVLWYFLQKEAELRLVKFLPEILALQRDLVKRFQNVSEAEYSSIRGFINSHHSDGLRKQLHDRITIFLSTWNALRRSLETNGEIKLPKDYCRSDLDLEAEFEVILPRRRGLGLCATALVSYLISLHNQMVYTVQKLSEENSSYSVDTSEVADVHVISYEVERDLTPLILSNCQYQVQQGGETSQEFDLEKIQRQISSRFLQGKPRLTLKGIPTLVYRHDWNYEHLFMNIKNRMPQTPLTNSAISAIGGQLQSYSDACEALSVIEVTLGFLSTAGGDPDMDLNVYIQDILQMRDQTALILKALNRCQLRHVIALWQFLSAHKSEQRLRLRKELFREIDVKYKEALSPQHAKLLGTFLNEAGLDAFLLELHEMIVLKLRGPQAESSFNPNWSLRDTLVSYMETKESEGLPEVESHFPEEILMSSCISVWEAAVTRKQDRQAR